MGTHELQAAHVIGSFWSPQQEPISVVRLSPEAGPDCQPLRELSDQAQAVIGKSLGAKFEVPVPDNDLFLSVETSPLDEIFPAANALVTIEYFLTLQGAIDSRDSQAVPAIGAVARIQHSRRRAYPTVTALETPNGLIGPDTEYSSYAAAALYAGLGMHTTLHRKVGAYPAHSKDAMDFYKQLGFRLVTRDDYVGDSRDSRFRYMEARDTVAKGRRTSNNLATVKYNLAQQFPFLKANGVL